MYFFEEVSYRSDSLQADMNIALSSAMGDQLREERAKLLASLDYVPLSASQLNAKEKEIENKVYNDKNAARLKGMILDGTLKVRAWGEPSEKYYIGVY